MEDGGPSQNTMSGTVLDNAMDFDLMEELLYDGFWLETSEGSHFWQPGPSTSSALNFSSYHTPTSETNIDLLNPNLHQKSDQEGRQRSGFVDNPPLVYPLMDDLVGSQTQKQESSSGQSENFPVESSEMNRRLWVAPSANSGPNSSVKKRLMQAIEYLTESTRERDLLIQIWVPIKKGGKNFLTTNNQPFSLNPNCKSLADYRDVSRGYHFAAEEDSKDFVGLPGRVFLKKLPEWTPDVRFFKREEYPRVSFARRYNVSGSLALPVFERGSGNCLGVVEIVTTSQKVNYRPELENVCKALEAVDLRSTEISSPPSIKACNNSYQIALAEIQEVLKSVCDKHGLPLAQTWASCFQQGKGGCRHSNESYPCCVSTIDSACYVLNPRVLGFQEACSEHHLLRGEGVAGGAFMTTQPCFAPDVKAFSKTEYPLSHHARIFGLQAAVAIRLRSIYTGSADFVLEFFLPSECQDAEEQRQVLISLTSDIQQFCRSLHCVTELELAEEAALSERVIAAPSGEENSKKLMSSLFEEPPQVESSWIDMKETQQKGKAVSVSVGYQKEEPQEDFKETIYWGKYKRDLHHANIFVDQQVLQESGSKGSSENVGDFSSAGGQHISGLTKGYEKRRTKSEKTISLQVLRQYFSGSLKDAAKSIGVCPTTLKRICRQHGITRWPSRKIKKVGHSLKKLQLVIDSVQGVEGAIQLSSFYSNFPEFSSPNFPVQNPVSTSNRNDPLKQFNVQTESTLFSPVATTSKSPSSSCSQSSSSSFSSSMEAKQPPIKVPVLRGEGGDASLPAPGMVIKRAHSEAELRDSGQEDTKRLVRSHSQKIFSELPSPEVLTSLPKVGSQSSREGGGFRAKATFRDEKIRLTIQPNWSFGDLKQEIAKRFNIEERQIYLKYLDDDSEWVLLTCDADLEECIDIHKSSKNRTIKVAVHQAFSLNLGRSLVAEVLLNAIVRFLQLIAAVCLKLRGDFRFWYVLSLYCRQ